MPRYKDFNVCVKSNNEALNEYGDGVDTQDPTRNTYSCWVASEEGKVCDTPMRPTQLKCCIILSNSLYTTSVKRTMSITGLLSMWMAFVRLAHSSCLVIGREAVAKASMSTHGP